MKPTAKDFIPVFGMYRYFKRYFKADKRNSEDALRAVWMEIYHMVTGMVFIMLIIAWFIIKI